MITIIQNKDRATFRVINDVAFDEVTVMMQDAEAADEMIYHLLVNVIYLIFSSILIKNHNIF